MPGGRRDILVIFGFAALAIVLLHAAFPILAWDRSINVEVRDSRTKEPLINVIVVATWEPKGMEGHVVEAAHAAEAITDADGRATLAAWGPKLKPGGRIREDEPHIRLLKEGYVPAIIPMRATNDRRIDPRKITANLEPADPAASKAYQNAVSEVVSSMRTTYQGRRCLSLRIPRAVILIERLYAPFSPRDSRGMYIPFNGLDGDVRCGIEHWKRVSAAK